MWVISEAGLVALVEDRDDPTKLQVRARVPEDIEATFPGAEVYVSQGADYRYRSRVRRLEVADSLHAAIMRLSYRSHFKDHAVTTSPSNRHRLDALYGCWEALAEMQDYRPYSLVPRSSELLWSNGRDEEAAALHFGEGEDWE